MKTSHLTTLGLAIAGILSASAALAEGSSPPIREVPYKEPLPALAFKPEYVKTPTHVIPQQVDEPNGTIPAANAGFGTRSAFAAAPAAVTPSATALTPPVSINYSGSSNTLTVTNNGLGKAILAQINNTSNNASALYGQTVGGGAGLTGYNGGTSGPAGKFGVTNASSGQPGVAASTSGTGAAVLGTVTKTNSDYPAVYGRNSVSSGNYGIGVQGDGGNIGVFGNANKAGVGVQGTTAGGGLGVKGITDSGIGVYGQSDSGYGMSTYSNSSYGLIAISNTANGIYAVSNSSEAIYATNTNTTNFATVIHAESVGGVGVFGRSTSYVGVQGNSTNGYGVLGQDFGTGYAVYGASQKGWAGYFSGKVGATSFVTLSDKNQKTHFKPIDGARVLEKVAQLPVTSWDFKSDLDKRHMGPMAQDFHAAFGLNGSDDTHINLADLAGVSLAAIKELNSQMTLRDRAKDERIARLEASLEDQAAVLAAQSEVLQQQSRTIAQLKSLTDQVTLRMAALENHASPVLQTAALSAVSAPPRIAKQ